MMRWWLAGLLLMAVPAYAQEPKEDPVENKKDGEQAPAWEASRAKGLELYQKGKITEAIQALGEARAQGATDSTTRLALGQAYLLREMHQKALIEFSEVLRHDPNHIQANLGRAESLIGLGDAKKAIGPVKLVTEIEPENARAWEILGNAYLHEQAQDFDKAQLAYRKALELNPSSRDAGVNLARALNYAKRVEEAITVLEAVRVKHPDDVSVMVKMAESFYAIRKLDKAELLLQEALELAPDDKEAKRVLGQVRSRQAYNFWVPIIAIIAFPLLYLAIRWMRRGKIPKVEEK
jgi:tetratricopeptide (TPR) repeat protein